MSLKICVYAICKNESAFAHRWMDSMSEADLVVVMDTGSEDDTVQKLKDRGATVYSERIDPWRFDVARNLSLEYVPDDTDICVCTDLDEVFAPGWRSKLEAGWIPEATRARYLFTSDFNEDGTPRKQFIKEKIHRRHGFKWVHPVHEILEYNGDDSDKSVFVPGIVLNHLPDTKKTRSHYLPLLELSARENPSDSQTVFWLGREYHYYAMHDLCIETMKKYLKLDTSNWYEERSAAMQFIAASYEAKGNEREAKAWIYKAIAEAPKLREPYLKAARLGYSTSDWAFTYGMVKNGLNVNEKTGSYLSDTDCWGYSFYDLGAIAAFHLGAYDESRELALIASELEPENERLMNNLQLIQAKIAEGTKNEAV